MSVNTNLPESIHFTLETLADGIYAAIHKMGGSADCNAGIIDLGELCLVFDALLTPLAAEDLRQSARSLVGYEPDLVINSHYHNDHCWGNQAFSPPAHVIASRQTYELMLTAGKKELEEETASASQTLAIFKDRYQKADSEDEKYVAGMFLGIYEGLVKDLPRLTMRLPDIIFQDRLSFKGTKRAAELIAYGNSHTGNDAVLFLPDDGIIFMGDLLFVGLHPYLADGDPANLAKTLQAIQDLKATRFVPGHGSPGTITDVNLLIEYIGDCEKTARTLVNEDKANKESISSMEVPERFTKWQLPTFHKANLRFLCEQMAAERG